MKDIKVLGSGCANCKTTLKLIEEVAQARGMAVKLEKVEDMAGLRMRALDESQIDLFKAWGSTGTIVAWAEVPNALADEFVTASQAAKSASTVYATDWLAAEIAALTKRVKEGETERLAMMTGEDAKEIKKELSVYVDDTTKPVAAPEAEE